MNWNPSNAVTFISAVTMDPGTLMPMHFGDDTMASLIGAIKAYSFYIAQYMRLYPHPQMDLHPKNLLNALIQYRIKTNTELSNPTN